MSNRPVLGSGPIPFLGTDRKLYFVPLSSLSVTEEGSIDATKWTQSFTSLKDEDRTKLGELLNERMNRGSIVAGNNAAPREAILFQAKTEGKQGNSISINVTGAQKDASEPENALKAKVSIEVTENVVFSKLSIDEVDSSFVGTVLAGKNKPSLLKIKALPDPVLYPKSGEYLLEAGVIGITQAASAGTSFTLEPVASVPKTELKATVEATDPNKKLFSIAVTRNAKVEAKLGDLISNPPANGANATAPSEIALFHAVVVLAPGGKSVDVAIPALGVYMLAGGSDAITTPANRSSVIAFTNE